MMLTYPYTIKNPVTSTFSLAKLSPNRPYLLWWYAALVKGSESGQNNLQVLFREILDRTDTGLELGKIVKEILPLPLLGQYRIGSIWINGKSAEEVHYPVVEFKVSFTSGCWRYKTFNAQSKSDKQNDPFPLDLYPLLYGANDFSRLIEFDLDNGGKLVLNGMDFFRAAYGHSPELKRILTSYPYQIKPPSQGDSILSLLLPPFPSHLKPSGNLDVLQPSHKVVKQDAVFLAHLKRDAYTQQVVHEFANNCFKSFFNQSKKGSIPFVFLAPEPWHTHPDVTIRVRGIPFDNQSFLGLNILGISDPPGPDIMWWKKSMASGSGSGGEPVIIRRTVKLSEVPVSATFAASWDAANLALPLHNQLIGDSYKQGQVHAPGYLVSTWRVWEDLLTVAARLGFGHSAVVPQKGFRLGTKFKVNTETEKHLLVFPDCMIKFPGARSDILLDAKYKGHVEKGKLRITESDIYEAIAFSRASDCNLVETFAKIPLRPTAEAQTQASGCFLFPISLFFSPDTR